MRCGADWSVCQAFLSLPVLRNREFPIRSGGIPRVCCGNSRFRRTGRPALVDSVCPTGTRLSDMIRQDRLIGTGRSGFGGRPALAGAFGFGRSAGPALALHRIGWSARRVVDRPSRHPDRPSPPFPSSGIVNFRSGVAEFQGRAAEIPDSGGRADRRWSIDRHRLGRRSIRLAALASTDHVWASARPISPGCAADRPGAAPARTSAPAHGRRRPTPPHDGAPPRRRRTTPTPHRRRRSSPR